jgi:GAF domain-containing protein
MTNDLSAGVEPVGRERDAQIEATLEALRADAEIAHVLLGFSSALAEVRTVDATTELAVRLVPKIMGCDRCFVAGVNRADERMYVMNSWGFVDDEARAFEKIMHTSGSFPLLRRAIHDRTPLIMEDAYNDERIPKEEAKLRNLGALMRIPLIREGEVFGALAIEYRNPRTFDAKDESLARGIARQLAVALANARQYNLLASLSRFGPRIATRFRLRQVSEEVARGAADLLGGYAAHLYLTDQARATLFPAAGAGADPPGRFERIDLSDEPWASLRTGGTAMVSHVDEDRPPEDPAATISAPVLGADGSLVGAVVVFFDHYVALGEVETEALKVLASLSALAIENAQSYERQRRVARSLQQGLLVTETPALLGSQIAAVYEPASTESDVGGDFYDVFELRSGIFGLVVGDVSGKGAEAAALTAQAKYMLRAFASRNRSSASVLFHLNNALCASLDDDRFATLLYIVYDTARQRCVVSSAGHPPALLFRAAGGTVEALELPGTILGVVGDQQFEQKVFELEPGDVLLAYTDGLTEARSQAGEMFERARVEGLLADLAPRTEPSELARAIYNEAKSFGRVTDDTVVFTLCCPRT